MTGKGIQILLHIYTLLLNIIILWELGSKYIVSS